MQTHRFYRWLLPVALSGWVPHAAACEFWYEETAFYRGYRGTCNLSDVFKEYGGVVELLPGNRLHVSLRLPDLNIINLHFGPGQYATEVEITADIENQGHADAPAVQIAAVVEVFQGGNKVAEQALLGPGQGSIAPGQSITQYIGTVNLPDRKADYELVVVATVDPPSPARPGGAVWESSEANNSRAETETVFALP